jgi:CheY-like chemotaxis protein
MFTGNARRAGPKTPQGVAGMDTVLIVDDSSFIVEGLIAFLKKKYRLLAAYGGAECLEILKHEIPSVIILDIMMEPMDGWETLSRIKENPQTRQIPVLMFSAKKVSPEEAEEHRIRIDDFIIKPVSPKKIIEAIEKVLARRDTYREFVERWRSAGISQEKIDQYLSLVTSLEVDLSLCQNMKIQYEFVQPQDKNQVEFQEVITAIEERIRHERELTDTLAREMNDALEKTRIDGGTGAVPVSGARPEIPFPSGPDTRYPDIRPETAESLPDGSPADKRIPVIPPLSETGPAEVLPATPPVETVPSAESTEIPSSGSNLQPKNGEVSDKDGGDPHDIPETVSEQTGTPPAEEKTALAPGGTPSVSCPEPSSAGSPGTLRTHSDYERLSEVHATFSGEEGISQHRSIVPADPDVPPAPRDELPTGAGTDVPVVWDRSRERKKSLVQSPARPEPSVPVSPTSGGLVARIIALVTGLFRKK